MRLDRDLNRTRERVLKAALAEFSSKGLAGARTNAIARRAGVDQRMIFYCFKTKQLLYHEVLRRKLAEIATIFESPSQKDFTSSLVNGYRANCVGDTSHVRMLQWEALQNGKRKLVAEEERRAIVRAQTRRLRDQKLRGELPADMDENMLLIASIAVRIFPMALPQLTRLLCGIDPTSPRFMRKWCKFLRWLGARITREQCPTTEVERVIRSPIKSQKVRI